MTFREDGMPLALVTLKADLVDRPMNLTDAPPERIGASAIGQNPDDDAERSWWRSLFPAG